MLYNKSMRFSLRGLSILCALIGGLTWIFVGASSVNAQNVNDYYGPDTDVDGAPAPGVLCCPVGTSKTRDANARGGKCSQEMYTKAGKNSNLEPCCGWFVKPDGAPNVLIEAMVDCKKIEPQSICMSIANAAQAEICKSCLKERGVYTALGCIPRSGDDLIISLARIGIGLLGGVLLIMILAAAFKLSTSRGDPKAFEEGKSMLTAGISGTLFILFSMVVLEAIGVNILRIPGF